eukprot:SAG31_NODE_755_length_12319_cov_6.335542_9_plen_141_part_00
MALASLARTRGRLSSFFLLPFVVCIATAQVFAIILAHARGGHADTNVATPLGDAYFLWPMMYNHFDAHYSQGRGNDGLLEARMAVSRDGTHNVSYISRDAWLSRGEGQPRVNHTGVYEGSFDAASTAVVRGICQVLISTL